MFNLYNYVLIISLIYVDVKERDKNWTKCSLSLTFIYKVPTSYTQSGFSSNIRRHLATESNNIIRHLKRIIQ
jgi:hypothetical protein